jgi:hypothetical protein
MKLTEALEMAIEALAVRRHQTIALAGVPANAPARETFLRHADQLEGAACVLRQHLERVVKEKGVANPVQPLPPSAAGEMW